MGKQHMRASLMAHIRANMTSGLSTTRQKHVLTKSDLRTTGRRHTHLRVTFYSGALSRSLSSLQTPEKYCLRINSSKRIFSQEEIEFLGHPLTPHGIPPTQDFELPVPVNNHYFHQYHARQLFISMNSFVNQEDISRFISTSELV